MNKVLTKTLKVVVLFIAVFCSGAAYAGDLEDGDAALLGKNYPLALSKYKSAAVKNNAYAQLQIGNMYNEGLGVAQDYAEAVKWWKMAAAQGFADAQYNLGLRYYNGQGVVQDYVRAHMWWNLAATKGDADSAKNRDIVAKKMTTQQIAEAQKLARECQARDYKNCD